MFTIHAVLRSRSNDDDDDDDDDDGINQSILIALAFTLSGVVSISIDSAVSECNVMRLLK